MPENRFFLDQPFEENLSAILDKEELYHLKVMRRKNGDIIELVNGRNQLAKAVFKTPHITILEISNSPPPTRQVILAQALLRPKNLELVIEKGTELGATDFWLFPAEKSEKKNLSPNQTHRLHQITISALKQCARLDLPSLLLLPPLPDWDMPPLGKAYFGDPSSKNLLIPHSGSITLFIGPEAGFTSLEKKFLCNSLNINGIRLNSNILRAETAALCGLAKICT